MRVPCRPVGLAAVVCLGVLALITASLPYPRLDRPGLRGLPPFEATDSAPISRIGVGLLPWAQHVGGILTPRLTSA
jgi:hypothetical protein